jgi:hypothetical protein
LTRRVGVQEERARGEASTFRKNLRCLFKDEKALVVEAGRLQMVSRRLFGRARAISRSLVSSCCAVAVLSGAAFAQQFAPPTEGDAFDARLTRFLSGDESSAATQADGTRFVRPSVASQAPAVPTTKPAPAKKSPIRQTSATFQSVKPSPIRQTQYAAAPTADATAQLANPLGGNDAPYVDECPDPNDMPSILDVPYKVVPKPGLFPERCPLPDDDYVRKAPTPLSSTTSRTKTGSRITTPMAPAMSTTTTRSPARTNQATWILELAQPVPTGRAALA